MKKQRASLAVVVSKLEQIHDDLVEVKKAVKEQNGRVRKLENWRSWIMGAVCIIAAGMTWAGTVLAKIIGQ